MLSSGSSGKYREDLIASSGELEEKAKSAACSGGEVGSSAGGKTGKSLARKKS